MMNERIAEGLRVLDAVAAVVNAPGLEHSRLVVLQPAQAIVELESGRVARILSAPSHRDGVVHIIDHALSHNGSEGTELVLVGGDAETRRTIEEAAPRLRMNAFYIHHLSSSAQVSSWPDAKRSTVARVLAQVQPLSPQKERQLFEKAAHDQARAHDEQRERSHFFSMMTRRAAPVTKGLLLAIFAIFLLQLSFTDDVMGALGISDPSFKDQQLWLVLAVAMGALWTPSVLDGELYRLISAGFLHFNLLHIAANSFVLFVLGAQMEKVLGSARFLLIYTVALLGGSLASTFLTDGVGVGASGAIWGLLGAQVALSYGRPPVLPASVARAMKPMAMRNLVLNVGISFVGGIDWAAHFGGGLFGGLLLASGVLYPKSENEQSQLGLLWAARAAALLLALGVLMALLEGKPWRLVGSI